MELTARTAGAEENIWSHSGWELLKKFSSEKVSEPFTGIFSAVFNATDRLNMTEGKADPTLKVVNPSHQLLAGASDLLLLPAAKSK